MMKTQKIFSQLNLHYPKHNFSMDNLTILHKGRFANAIVYRYKDSQFNLVIKDFQTNPWFIRKTLGPLFINQEYNALARLSDMTGITNDYYRLSKLGIAYGYIEGTSLRTLRKQGDILPLSFLKRLEQMVAEMHQRGLVHLDLRNFGNIIMGLDGQPYLIDFQSVLSYYRYPRWLQHFMRGSDLSGVYKVWDLMGETPLGGIRKAFYAHYNQYRKGWIFRGYPLHRTFASLSNFGQKLMNSNYLQRVKECFLKALFFTKSI